MDQTQSCQCSRPDLRELGDSRFCLSCGLADRPDTKISHKRKADEAGIDSVDNKRAAPPNSGRILFEYEQLKHACEFRLLRLFPGGNKNQLEGEVFHADVSHPPVYEALSYTWGQSKLTQELHTTTGLIKITENCFAALTGLRHDVFERIIWVDAICIAQSDDLEKNHQIPLMARIYAAAAKVLIYLGDQESLDTGYLFDRLRRNEIKLRDGAITEFLSLPWFSRVWVLQEVAMASYAVVVLGSATLEWRHLSIGNIHAVGLDPTDISGQVPPVLQMSISNRKPVKDLPSFIAMARRCLSSDPRDRFYALLGLVDERACIDLVPDYTKTAEEVFTDITVQFLRKYNCLHFLSGIESFDGSLLNSSAPTLELSELCDLKTNPRMPPLQALHGHLKSISSDLEEAVAMDYGRYFPNMIDLVLSDEPETPHQRFHKIWLLTEELLLDLKTQGIYYMPESIRKLSDTLHNLPAELGKRRSFGPITEKWPDLPADTKQLFKSKLEICKSWESKLETLEAALARFSKSRLINTARLEYEGLQRSDDLFTSRLMERESAKTVNENLELPTWVPDYRHCPKLSSFAEWKPDTFTNELVACLHTSSGTHFSPFLEVKAVLLDRIEGIFCPPISSVRLCGTEVLLTTGFRDHFTQSLITINYGAHISGIVQFSRGRKVVLTEASLAIVPPGFELGDIIAVLYGGTVPYLLRPSPSKSDRFQFIGECYLHGVRGPQFAPNYAGLLGWFKNRVMGQGERDNLPWRTIFLE